MKTNRAYRESPSQTAGPYVHIGLTPNFSGVGSVYPYDLGSLPVDQAARGERIAIEGLVLDGAEVPLKDALLEIWQADAAGIYPSPADPRSGADPSFKGWARSPTHMTTGLYRFETVKPGCVPFKDGRLMAPHITFWIVARGINMGLQTRLYFADETTANAEDPVLARIEHRERVQTLIAQRADQQSDMPLYRFDIRLHGPSETVFFDI